jgi:hypothetical protein
MIHTPGESERHYKMEMKGICNDHFLLKLYIHLMCHTPTLGNEDHDKMHMMVVYEFWFWFKKLVWDLDRISA